MVNTELRNGRGKSQHKRAAAQVDVADGMPLVSAKRGKFEPLRDAKVEALVFARLTCYKEFIKELEGEEPEDGAIISAGLEMLFDADKGFERWVAEQRRKNRNGAPTSANGDRAKAVAPGATV